MTETKASEQCVAARDTTFDNVIPNSLWASVRTTPDRKYIQFIIEVNGIEKVIERAYVGDYDGIISSSTQLTWILHKQKDAYTELLSAALELRAALVKIGEPDDINTKFSTSKDECAYYIEVAQKATKHFDEKFGGKK